MFLNLLVAQIQNQDPLNPTDSTQFVSQLAQFSELEQVIGIRSDIESQMSASTLAQANNTANQENGTTPSTGTANSTSNTGQTTSATTN
jgi:flagellar basal-body rod modification protein FlgD